MKTQALLRVSVLALLTFIATTFGRVAMSTDSDLPGQIDEYYRNYNYVSLFSSEIERELIADSLMCEGTLEWSSHSDLDFCNEIPSLPASQRLDRTRALIIGLSEDVIRDRNSMSIQEYVPGEGAYLRRIDPEMQPLRQNPYAPLPELYQVTQTTAESDAITVEATVYQLEPLTNTRLISRYETYEGMGAEIPSNENLLQLAAPSSILRREHHHWIMENGTWKRFESGAVLVNTHFLQQ